MIPLEVFTGHDKLLFQAYLLCPQPAYHYPADNFFSPINPATVASFRFSTPFSPQPSSHNRVVITVLNMSQRDPSTSTSSSSSSDDDDNNPTELPEQTDDTDRWEQKVDDTQPGVEHYYHEYDVPSSQHQALRKTNHPSIGSSSRTQFGRPMMRLTSLMI